MAKHSKRSILAIVLTLCAALCIGLFAACNDDPTTQAETYTITVTTDDDTPVKGVEITVNKGGASFDPKTTDDNGKVTFELVPDDYELSLGGIPDGYDLPADDALKLNKIERDYTVKLNKKFAYVVNLVNPDGMPFTVEGDYTVGICYASDASRCLTPVTPENGVARIEADKDDYHVQIVDLPAGYIFEGFVEGEESNYYTGPGCDFSATVTEMTIVIAKPEVIDPAKDGMTDAEKTKFKTDAGSRANAFDTSRKAFNITGTLNPGASTYYVITPELTGMYNLYENDEFVTAGVEKPENSLNCYYTQEFKVKGTDEDIVPTARGMNLKKGVTYYIAIVNGGNTKVKLNSVLDVPFNSYYIYNGVGGTLELTVGKADTKAIVEFNPNSAGKYELAVKTATADAFVAGYNSLPAEAFITEGENADAPAADKYVKSASYEYDYSAKAFTQKVTVYYAVAVKADKYPVTISVELKKTGNTDEVYEYAEVKETLTKFGKEEHTELYGVPMDGTATLVYDEDNNVFKYNDKVVVVNITGALDKARYADGGRLAYLGIYTNMSTAFRPSYTYVDGNTTTDYTLFLRGFENYEYKGRDEAIPDKSNYKTQNCYANFVNEDGVYPLTKELKAFLEKFWETNEIGFFDQVPADTDFGCEWMFPLYYYDVETVADEICGDYVIVSYKDEAGEEYVVGKTDNVFEDDYLLHIYKNGNFTMTQYIVPFGQDEGSQVALYEGKWEKTGASYSFVVKDGATDDDWVLCDLHFVITFDSENGTVKLVVTEGEYPQASDDKGATEWTFVKGAPEV